MFQALVQWKLRRVDKLQKFLHLLQSNPCQYKQNIPDMNLEMHQLFVIEHMEPVSLQENRPKLSGLLLLLD